MKLFLRTSLFLLLVLLGPASLTGIFPLPETMPASAAEQGWKTEFDDICKKTTDAMSLSRDELKLLLARGEKLRAVIETLDETEKKVYLKRLRLCQELFAFVLESKEKQ